MKAGPELNALVAEKVIGLPPLEIIRQANGNFDEIRGWSECPIDQGEEDAYTAAEKPQGKRLIFWMPRPYSTSIADALPVLEKMKEVALSKDSNDHVYVRIESCNDGTWEVGLTAWNDDNQEIGLDYRFKAQDKDLPYAICLAALKVFGVEIEKEAV